MATLSVTPEKAPLISFLISCRSRLSILEGKNSCFGVEEHAVGRLPVVRVVFAAPPLGNSQCAPEADSVSIRVFDRALCPLLASCLLASPYSVYDLFWVSLPFAQS